MMTSTMTKTHSERVRAHVGDITGPPTVSSTLNPVRSLRVLLGCERYEPGGARGLPDSYEACTTTRAACSTTSWTTASEAETAGRASVSSKGSCDARKMMTSST